MISASIPIGTFEELPRRDLRAMFLYLNRKDVPAPPPCSQCERIDAILQKIAAASRFQ